MFVCTKFRSSHFFIENFRSELHTYNISLRNIVHNCIEKLFNLLV